LLCEVLQQKVDRGSLATPSQIAGINSFTLSGVKGHAFTAGADAERVGKLREVLETRLLPAVLKDSAPLELTAFCVRGEPISHADAVRGEFAPIAVGDAWGPPWSTTWFHVRGSVPPDWAGQKVVAHFDLGYLAQTGFTCEALAWKDGVPWRGVDPNHQWLPIQGSDVDFYVEAAANPTATLSGPEPAPSMIALRESPEAAFILYTAELRIQDESARRVALDFKVALELAEAIPDGDPRREILEALDRFAEAGDPKFLTDLLSMPAAATHRISAVGHAHIDTAWLWPIRETRRKCARSFSTQLALMDEYPDYRFACSQAVQYAWMKESYPSIYEGIRQKVANGQWEPVGGMWVEPDCNLPSGEALARQLLHGKRFFIQEFGYEPRDVWLPDVFGYPASLPQLIAAAGSRFFLTQKLSWNETNKPAHHTFLWEGIDGTRIFTHFPPADTYNGDFSAREVVRSAANFKDHDRSLRSLYLYGRGDGGGGPDPEMIESAHSLMHLPGAPGIELSRAVDFFEAASTESHDLTTWVGELYFELHRGTYTTQARTKLLNRRAEQALREAEIWSVASGRDYPANELDAAWKQLLTNQFHDILPGSSIDWVYEDSERDLRAVIETAARITSTAIEGLVGAGDELVVFNVNSHPRREVVDLGDRLAVVEAPSCGWAAVDPATVTHEHPVVVSDGRMENELLRVRWDGRGLLTSIWDKVADREVLAAGTRGNVLQLYEDNPARWDAWDIDSDYQKHGIDLLELSRQEVEVAGGLRGAVRFMREFGRSRISQRMVLDAGSRVLRFECEVDWHEDHKLLKVAFPVAVHSPRASYEIQFGHIERTTHTNTSWDQARFEVCAHRWADLGEAGYGVALLNDCKYGYDIRGSVMRLSLLRAPTHPDPTADRGAHLFTYALMPHPGDFREAGVIAAAEDLNSPLRIAPGIAKAERQRSLIELDNPQIIVETVKRAEDSDATVVRLYESWGGRTRARLRTTLPATRATLCDLMERELEEVPLRHGVIDLELAPFKILTLKLARSTGVE
jgi:alpha-mannosidase